MSTTPGPGYSSASYLACMEGRADQGQQQSVAAQIILLHAANGELTRALEAMLEYFASEEEAEANESVFNSAREALAKSKKYKSS